MAVSVPFPDWHSLDSRETETETREKEDGIGGDTEHGRDLEISRQWGKEVVVACKYIPDYMPCLRFAALCAVVRPIGQRDGRAASTMACDVGGATIILKRPINSSLSDGNRNCRLQPHSPRHRLFIGGRRHQRSCVIGELSLFSVHSMMSLALIAISGGFNNGESNHE